MSSIESYKKAKALLLHKCNVDDDALLRHRRYWMTQFNGESALTAFNRLKSEIQTLRITRNYTSFHPDVLHNQKYAYRVNAFFGKFVYIVKHSAYFMTGFRYEYSHFYVNYSYFMTNYSAMLQRDLPCIIGFDALLSSLFYELWNDKKFMVTKQYESEMRTLSFYFYFLEKLRYDADEDTRSVMCMATPLFSGSIFLQLFAAEYNKSMLVGVDTGDQCLFAAFMFCTLFFSGFRIFTYYNSAESVHRVREYLYDLVNAPKNCHLVYPHMVTYEKYTRRMLHVTRTYALKKEDAEKVSSISMFFTKLYETLKQSSFYTRDAIDAMFLMNDIALELHHVGSV